MVKQIGNTQNKMGSKGSKWSSLNAPGTQSPLYHPILKLDEISFLHKELIIVRQSLTTRHVPPNLVAAAGMIHDATDRRRCSLLASAATLRVPQGLHSDVDWGGPACILRVEMLISKWNVTSCTSCEIPPSTRGDDWLIYFWNSLRRYWASYRDRRLSFLTSFLPQCGKEVKWGERRGGGPSVSRRKQRMEGVEPK